jgi:hypothetical protein
VEYVGARELSPPLRSGASLLNSGGGDAARIVFADGVKIGRNGTTNLQLSGLCTSPIQYLGCAIEESSYVTWWCLYELKIE